MLCLKCTYCFLEIARTSGNRNFTHEMLLSCSIVDFVSALNLLVMLNLLSSLETPNPLGSVKGMFVFNTTWVHHVNHLWHAVNYRGKSFKLIPQFVQQQQVYVLTKKVLEARHCRGVTICQNENRTAD